tara:strand:- start:685 stop:1032 length:348 start_codon:yes stop_codon:yes gene_type:complete
MEADSDVDQFIRHLQAELEETSEILDLQAREHRQWQIEVAIQESLKYLKKIDERKILGLDAMFKEKEAVRIISKKQNITKSNSINHDEEGTQICTKCESEITENLGFCESCGFKL